MNSTAELADKTVVSTKESHDAGLDHRVTVCTSWDEMERLRPQWDEILRANPALTIFSTFEWLQSWWRAFGAGKELVSLICSDYSGNIVAIVPLYRERVYWKLGLYITRLRLVGDGSGDSDNLDLIVFPGHECAVARMFERWLRTAAVDICELNTMHSESAAAQAVLDELSTSRWKLSNYDQPWSAVILPETWQGYLAQLSSKERLKVGNRLRRLQARYTVEFRKCTSRTELPSQLQTLFALHQKRWEARGKPGSFRSEERKNFYSLMSEQFLRQGWLELWTLLLNGEPVAAQFGFRYGSTVFSLQEGFDPEHSADSVGYVLRSYVLQQLINSGIRRYEFLAGADESKLRWGGETGHYLNIHVAAPRTWGSLHLQAARTIWKAKTKVRTLYPGLTGSCLAWLERIGWSRANAASKSDR